MLSANGPIIDMMIRIGRMPRSRLSLSAGPHSGAQASFSQAFVSRSTSGPIIFSTRA